MKKIIFVAVVGVALAVTLITRSTNITNYPVTTTFDASKWFLLSLPGSQTNENLPGSYVASVSELNAASNTLRSLFTGMTGIDFTQTNAVITNGVALKVPVLTNGATVFYFILFTNVP